MNDRLLAILRRKSIEVRRRHRHAALLPARRVHADRRPLAMAALRRQNGRPAVIAEIKFRSPSAGTIRPWRPTAGRAVASSYLRGGARALSVLCDYPGFGGSVLELRRIARAHPTVPVLFKEFVIDPVQVRIAAAAGASMVLLLVSALSDEFLTALIRTVDAEGMLPVVEAADRAEVERAVRAGADVIGVNARDLRSFAIDPRRAADAIASVPSRSLAVYMSGVEDSEGLLRVAASRADAVLIGSALMRAPDPGLALRELLARSNS